MAEHVQTKLGNGGELHQQVPERVAHENTETHLTTNQGIRISDNQTA